MSTKIPRRKFRLLVTLVERRIIKYISITDGNKRCGLLQKKVTQGKNLRGLLQDPVSVQGSKFNAPFSFLTAQILVLVPEARTVTMVVPK